MSTPGDSFTVKEMLLRMEARADERHDELQGSLRVLTVRVDRLEHDQAERTGWLEGRDKVAAGLISLLVILVNVPAFIYYLSGAR